MKRIIFLVGVIVMTLGTTMFAAAQTTDPIYSGWNCADATEPDYCTRTLVVADTGWGFAGQLFNNGFLWKQFVDDNPDKTKVKGTADKPILVWKVGDKIRVRKSALSAIASGTVKADTATPPPVTVQLNTVDEGLPWWVYTVLIPFSAFGLLVAIAIAVVGAYLGNRNSKRQQETPLDPDSGQPMRGRVPHFLRIEPTVRDITATSNRLRTSGASLTGERNHGDLRRIIRASLTIAESARIITEFRDGNRQTRPDNSDVFLSVYYTREGNVTRIADIAMGFAFCDNGALMNLLSAAEKQLFCSSAVFSNPRVIWEGSNAPQPFNFEDVVQFLRAQAAQQTEQAAAAETAPVAAPAPVENAPAATVQPVAPQMQYSMEGGLTIVGGVIDLGNGAKLDLTGGGTVNVNRQGQMDINGIPLETIDQKMISESTQ